MNRRIAIAVTVAALAGQVLIGCAAVPGQSAETAGQSATPGVKPPTVPVASASPASGQDIPVPDATEPLHDAGEQVELDGAVIAYDGVFETSGRLIARFTLVSGSMPADARVLTPAGPEPLQPEDTGRWVTPPFGSSSEPPAMNDTLTLMVDQALVPFRIGRVR